MSVGKGGNSVGEDVPLSVEGGKRYFPGGLTIDLVLVASQTGHVTSEDLLVEQALLVVFVGDGVAQNRPCDAFRSFPAVVSDVRVHLAPQADEVSHNLATQFVFELSNDFLVRRRVQRVVGWIVGCIV